MFAHRSRLALALMLLCVGSGAAFLKYRESGREMTQAAQDFLAGLDEGQRSKARMDFDDPKRVDWHFIPKEQRKGLQLRDMNDQQRKLAAALLAASLSQAGHDKAVQIMDLEKILEKLEGPQARFRRDYLRYYFTVFGQPAEQGRWGLSIEGHHLSLNFVVENGKIVSHTPAMFGANPALVMSDVGVGPAKGTRVLAQEELLAFELLGALNDEQRQKAIIAEKAPADIRAAGQPQPPDAPPEGLPACEFNDQQLGLLRRLIEVYARNMPEEVAASRLAQIKEAGPEKVHFAWAGSTKPGVGHYYRLQGPTFLVEFVNTQPDSAGNPANHIHAVWRDTAGDFGLPLKR